MGLILLLSVWEIRRAKGRQHQTWNRFETFLGWAVLAFSLVAHSIDHAGPADQQRQEMAHRRDLDRPPFAAGPSTNAVACPVVKR
ncbi:hypothetical protein ACFCV3_21310 [Kribbella sp. NPDC056345]|uniref:hypothetical protein n=1 Tax=Kribbella sp. NPDC056345 TaxID=3345789 RepID=UPI0035E33FC1